MTAQLTAVRVGARQPQALARFWAGLLEWEVVRSAPDDALVAGGETTYALHFGPSDAVKNRQNRIHLDLTSDSPEEQHAIVQRGLALGGRHADVGQSGDESHVVLADPEGNELCVIDAGNGFLAGCGRVGAINCDGTQRLGYFWADALGWPLVWDQDEETAVQSPQGGSKVTWSGPPLMPRDGTTPIELEVVPSADSDVATEVQRLLGLGASAVEPRPDHAQAPRQGEVVLIDPDGNRFRVLTAR